MAASLPGGSSPDGGGQGAGGAGGRSVAAPPAGHRGAELVAVAAAPGFRPHRRQPHVVSQAASAGARPPLAAVCGPRTGVLRAKRTVSEPGGGASAAATPPPSPAVVTFHAGRTGGGLQQPPLDDFYLGFFMAACSRCGGGGGWPRGTQGVCGQAGGRPLPRASVYFGEDAAAAATATDGFAAAPSPAAPLPPFTSAAAPRGRHRGGRFRAFPPLSFPCRPFLAVCCSPHCALCVRRVTPLAVSAKRTAVTAIKA